MSESRKNRRPRETEDGITDHKRLVAAKRALNRKYEEYEIDDDELDSHYEAEVKYLLRR